MNFYPFSPHLLPDTDGIVYQGSAYSLILLSIRVLREKWRWEGPYFYFWPIPCNYMPDLKVNNAVTNFEYCIMGFAISCLFKYIIETKSDAR
jgi:hypothetical protein